MPSILFRQQEIIDFILKDCLRFKRPPHAVAHPPFSCYARACPQSSGAVHRFAYVVYAENGISAISDCSDQDAIHSQSATQPSKGRLQGAELWWQRRVSGI
jgi:hypothetical protein